MSKIAKMYKSFFGLKEQTNPNKPNKLNIPSADEIEQTTDAVKELGDAMDDLNEEEIDEARLINNMTDYRGGIQYLLRDPAMAENVAQEIKNFAAKKKIYIIRHLKSKDGKIGYFHFRLGEDPARESQQLQGYISQKPEVHSFRFKILGEKKPKINPRRQRPNI